MAVKAPVRLMPSEAKAPATVPSSNARTVPRACPLMPSARPISRGSRIRRIRLSHSTPKMAVMPVVSSAPISSAREPPSSSASPSAMGEVTDLGASEASTSLGAPMMAAMITA